MHGLFVVIYIYIYIYIIYIYISMLWEVFYMVSSVQNYYYSSCCLKENLNASSGPSEHPPVRGKMSKRLGGIIGCKDQTNLSMLGF